MGLSKKITRHHPDQLPRVLADFFSPHISSDAALILSFFDPSGYPVLLLFQNQKQRSMISFLFESISSISAILAWPSSFHIGNT
jgi:hypothetical protein